MIQVGAEVYDVISPSFDGHHEHQRHRDFDFRITIAIFLLISLDLLIIIAVFFKVFHDIHLCHAFLANELMVGVESP